MTDASTTHPLIEAMTHRVVLCDGGMGTQLIARGLGPGESAELWNLDRPDDVRAIHRAYRAAGCELLTTNTFQGTSTALAQHGLARRADAINRAGAALALEVADGAWVLGDVGPFGGFLEPLGETSPRQLRDIFHRQIAALIDGGADALVVETMSDHVESRIAIETARSLSDIPVLATFAFQPAGKDTYRTMMGVSVADAIAAAIEAGACAVGANCGSTLGLDEYEQLAGQILEVAGDTPVMIQPNAGSPEMVDGTLVHPAGPNEMAALATRLAEAGVRIIGGCCGTTPDHLRAMGEVITSP